MAMDLQALISSPETEVHIPAGEYIVHEPLTVPSHKHIFADRNAHIVFVPERPMIWSDFLLTNDNMEDGNEDIWVDGGIWDGGFGHEFNVKPNEIFENDSSSGSCLNFINVKGLKLTNLTVKNSVVYFIRLGRVRDFEIRNIVFDAEKRSWNQDGVHFSGFCHDGIVDHVTALNGETNDDLIALNADDSVQRLENRALMCGPIENIVIRNVYAENCYTAIRMASVNAPIRHIRIENVYTGCRVYAVNMDAARYCRTPLFQEASAPNGVGYIKDVTIDNFTAFFTDEAKNRDTLLCLEEHCKGFTITNFRRPKELDRMSEVPTIAAKNLTRQKIEIDGNETLLTRKEDRLIHAGDFSTLKMDLIEG